MPTIATEIGKTVATAEGVKRNEAPPEGFTGNAVNQAFAGPEGHVANAEGAGPARILLKVDKVIEPAFFAEASRREGDRSSSCRRRCRSDLIATYNGQLLANRTVTDKQQPPISS